MSNRYSQDNAKRMCEWFTMIFVLLAAYALGVLVSRCCE